MTDKILTFEEYTMESIKKVLNEEPQMNTDLITEMARINTDESNLFHHNSYEIQIWSNDYTPPHFHVIAEGWDVSFKIKDGKLLKINKKGNNSATYQYMINNVPKWLDAPAAIMPKITNRENANAIWKQIHN